MRASASRLLFENPRRIMLRRVSILLHRWIGLTMAGFLIVVGLTGSLLAFLPELNQLIAPALFPGPHGPELDPVTLMRKAEADVPGMRANTIYLGYLGTAQIGFEPLPGAARLDFDQIYLDSVTGEELGRVKRSLLPSSAGEITPFIYRLHYELALGEIGGWILGLIALAWTLDCFVAFYLTLPPTGGQARKSYLSRWKPSWLVKTRGSFYRINFDLHRASGLWLWITLLIFAWSSVFMDLNGFYTRATRLFLDFEQPMWARAVGPIPDRSDPMELEPAYANAQRLMKEQASQLGFEIERPLAFYLMREKGVFEYRVRSSRDIGDKYGSTEIHFDSHSGALVSVSVPTGHRSGDTLTTWLVELHMANVFGLPYKLFVCSLGIIIAMLSITGVYIWWKKRRARVVHSTRAAAQSITED
jgi:uncharacterized iron-regulated membrane protein